jgi:Leucine-rich repeat (LRR) protein
LIVVLLCQCKKEIEQKIIAIPDDNFLNALIKLGVDTNGDGFISPDEAEVITFLDVSDKSISDMTGIEAFVNLDSLYCSWNLLTTLDVSNNTALTYFWCTGNQLTSLDVSNNTAILSLRIGGMPSLNQVCVWTLPFPPSGVYVSTDVSPNVYFTTDCKEYY